MIIITCIYEEISSNKKNTIFFVLSNIDFAVYNMKGREIDARKRCIFDRRWTEKAGE